MKNLIIPIEIKHREILGAISLSYSALNNGWTVFLGQKSQIFPFIPFFYKSIWFLKSIVPGEISNLIKIKKYGHKLTTLDVEGLILSNGDFGPIKRYSEQTIELAEAIFYWGAESHYEPVKKVFPNIKNKSFVTGSPIVDTWFLEKNNFYSKKKLIKKTNKSILISVNFARADPKLKKARKFYEKFYSGFQNFRGNDIVNYNNLIEAEYKLKEESFKYFKDIIPKISKRFKYHEIIVRPHPEENNYFWTSFLANFENIKVDNSNSTTTQILNCDIFIHFNSTMSVQSCYLDKVTLMYNPIKDEILNNAISPITQDVSLICKNIDQLYANIENPNFKQMKIRKDRINKYINIDTSFKNKNYSSNQIVEIINKIKINKNKYSSKHNLYSLKSFYAYFIFHAKFFVLFILGNLSIIFPFLRSKYNRFRWRYLLGRKKWSKTSENDIYNYFNSLFNDNNFQSKLKIKKHFSGFFILELKNKE